MNSFDKHKSAEPESDDEELSENVERNLESILCIFPLRRKGKDKLDKIDNNTFEKVKHLMQCPICLEIFKEPAYIKECMHRFCKQCIERIIRTQDNKGCPICRLPLGSKRVLRNDSFIENCIKKIFPNLKEYLNLEDFAERSYFSSKLRETTDPKSKKKRELKDLENFQPDNTLRLKRSSSHKEPKRRMRNSDDENSDENLEERKQKKVKRKKPEDQEYPLIDTRIETKEEIPLEAKTDIKEATMGISQIIGSTSKEDMAILKQIINSSNLELYLSSCEVVKFILLFDLQAISFGFEPLPSHSYLKYLDNQVSESVFRTSSAITIEFLCQFLCKKLNLQAKEFQEKIHLWGKKENKFEPLDRQKSVKDIAKMYWSHINNTDIELYDVYAAIEEYVDKKIKPSSVQRILYYSIDEEFFFN